LGQGTRFSDLSDEDKAKVVGGLAGATVSLVTFYVFLFGDPLRLASLSQSGSIFTVASIGLLGIFAIVLTPMIIAFFFAASFYMKQPKGYWVKSFLAVLVPLGASILFTASVMILLSIFLVNAPLEIQAILMVLAITSSITIMVRIFLSKKIGRRLGYIKKGQ
jgi:hypothetical protein